ncbi:hypothetical protein A374_06296 [Fictibacillus macauensis ZFHKF-1]|uniref:Uncharacterized protein n=1 Tax=Fictibacillus macauensis ZFHKF-1 TaxID=1196324 RepID=I8AK39_9BACL|nr:hypothetical protein A374_06296 [Fictibacillus macauensis ZFHKF-1]
MNDLGKSELHAGALSSRAREPDSRAEALGSRAGASDSRAGTLVSRANKSNPLSEHVQGTKKRENQELSL